MKFVLSTRLVKTPTCYSRLSWDKEASSDLSFVDHMFIPMEQLFMLVGSMHFQCNIWSDQICSTVYDILLEFMPTASEVRVYWFHVYTKHKTADNIIWSALTEQSVMKCHLSNLTGGRKDDRRANGCWEVNFQPNEFEIGIGSVQPKMQLGTQCKLWMFLSTNSQ